MHGGQVEATSGGVGQGSEFVVKLPAAPAMEQPQITKATHSDAKSSVQRSILVVDDNADAADSLAMLLRLKGHQATVANDGPTALRLVGEQHPQIIILDLGMPIMDGYEVARRLLAEHRLNETLLVALTGWGQSEDRRRCLEAGFDLHLVKPVEPGALEQLLRHPQLKVR
jgi:CheY-like chemotaxis protein